MVSSVIVFSKEGITKALNRLRGCTGWSASLLLACHKVRFPRVETHIVSSYSAQKFIIIHLKIVSGVVSSK